METTPPPRLGAARPARGAASRARRGRYFRAYPPQRPIHPEIREQEAVQ